MTKKFVNEMVIVFYVFDGKCFGYVVILNTKIKTTFKNLFDSLIVSGINTSKNEIVGDEGHDKAFE